MTEALDAMVKQTIQFDGFTLEIEAPKALEGLWAGDWYPKVTMILRAPGIEAKTMIEPSKATELSMALRVAVNATRGQNHD